jgi:hypothetical protein
MKRRISLLPTLFRRERYQMPQRTNLYVRIVPDARNTGGKGWTVFVTKDVRQA